jgi:hypothetical protein
MSKYETVAKAIRLEVDESKDDVYIIFKIVDERFKQKVREDWREDIEVKLVNKNLVKEVDAII